MRKLILLTCLAAGCVADPYSFRQRGLVAAPRAPLYDGQPMATGVQASGYVATSRAPSAGDEPRSGAAIARDQAGASLRGRVGPNSSVGVTLDRSWHAAARTISGESTDAARVPDDAVYGVAFEARHSAPVSPQFRVGLLVEMGGQSHPIRRDAESYPRHDVSFRMHGAVVPSWHQGSLTVFGVLGAGTESDVPASVIVTPDNSGSNDPGAVAGVAGAFGSAAVGVTVDLGPSVHLTAQGSQAVGSLATYGQRIDVGLTFELGDAAKTLAAQ